jgi:hypothetical protein
MANMLNDILGIFYQIKKSLKIEEKESIALPRWWPREESPLPEGQAGLTPVAPQPHMDPSVGAHGQMQAHGTLREAGSEFR